MKINLIAILIGLLLYNTSFGQRQDEYSTLTKEAWELYEAKAYKESAKKYKEAFEHVEGKAYPRDRYNAACSFALAEDMDGSFYHLFKLAESPKTKYKNYEHITTDTDLSALHADERWEKLIAIVKANKEEADKYLDKELVAILDTIRIEYIQNRHLMKDIIAFEEKNADRLEETKSHRTKINAKDSIHLIKVKKILDDRGWLGPKIVGDKGNNTFFLIIRNADRETQAHYLPMLREAVKEGNAAAKNLAFLEDLEALRNGDKQIYGSQIGQDQETGAYYVIPLEAPENVDKRRAEIGLGPLANYVKRWEIRWDIEQHKERTKKLEATEE